MTISLKDKKALVGGSTSGIGRAIAVQLAQSGAELTLMSHSEDTLQSLMGELPCDHGQKHGYLVVDFTDYPDFERIIEEYFKDHTVDILVNNTQGPSAGNTLEKKVSDYQQAFELLFKTVVRTTELALPGMLDRGWGRVINVASVSVKEPLSYLALSNTIRSAVVTWAKSLATDVGPQGITVNSILTGYFDTGRIQDLNAKKAEQAGISLSEVRADMEARVPLRRIGDPKEYGYLVAFLASEEAGYITGTQIPLDGGLLKSL